MRIVMAFPGTGKTYLKHQLGSSVMDLDSSGFRKTENWEEHYVDIVETIIRENRFDLLLLSMYTRIMEIMSERGISFEAVIPHSGDEKTNRMIKEMMFGRYTLRDNSHIRHIGSWFSKMKECYDEWTDPEEIMKYTDKVKFINLEHPYLDDVL